MIDTRTAEDTHDTRALPGPPSPGVILVFTEERPAYRPYALGKSGLIVGREDERGGTTLQDERASRRHAKVDHDGARWKIADLGSRNGTFVDGRAVGTDGILCEDPRVLRVGRSLFVFAGDVRPFSAGDVERTDDRVVGPTLRAAYDRIARAAAGKATLLVSGESGVGKELAARLFHTSSERRGGPFVAVNCAAIPDGLAERLLFGARRGAYSGADADADGYVQAANGGTLFLDEVGELSAPVQAKMLRLLESGEVTPLGASKPAHVNLGFVCATNRPLRSEVEKGSFREDLFYRVGQGAIELPPLRERREEIPWLVTRELAALDARLQAHSSLVEACLVRDWRGNVRELRGEVKRAAYDVVATGGTVVESLPPDSELPPAASQPRKPASSRKGKSIKLK